MANKETYVIYYNAKCGKCRTAKSALETAKLACEITEYLKEVPDKNTLKKVFTLLRKKPLEVIRKKEDIFKDKYAGKILSDDQWIDAIIEHPILLERPIIVGHNKAWVARDPETLQAIIEDK